MSLLSFFSVSRIITRRKKISLLKLETVSVTFTPYMSCYPRNFIDIKQDSNHLIAEKTGQSFHFMLFFFLGEKGRARTCAKLHVR